MKFTIIKILIMAVVFFGFRCMKDFSFISFMAGFGFCCVWDFLDDIEIKMSKED